MTRKSKVWAAAVYLPALSLDQTQVQQKKEKPLSTNTASVKHNKWGKLKLWNHEYQNEQTAK